MPDARLLRTRLAYMGDDDREVAALVERVRAFYERPPRVLAFESGIEVAPLPPLEPPMETDEQHLWGV